MRQRPFKPIEKPDPKSNQPNNWHQNYSITISKPQTEENSD